MNEASEIACDVIAVPGASAVLQEIALQCAADVGQALVLNDVLPADPDIEPTIVLHLSAKQAASQHPVWCLACQLACFCPEARVSVLIRGEFSLNATDVEARRGA